MEYILVDSSIWMDHFRIQNELLIDLLNKQLVSTHPLIITEIACGSLKDRKKTISDLNLLPKASQPGHKDILDFIEREKLFSQGCGTIDITLLASTLTTPQTKLWTLDKRLKELARRFGVMYRQTLH